MTNGTGTCPARREHRLLHAAIDRHGSRCAYCRDALVLVLVCTLEPDVTGYIIEPAGLRFATLDHVLVHSAGGSDEPANLRPACHSCNSRKGARAWTPLS